LHGLMRVQQITQDDAHIFSAPEMIEKEVSLVLKLIKELYQPFSLKREMYLSTRPDNALGDKKTWDKAENALKNALKKNNLDFGIKEKDGAFYGPKIDIQIKDCLGRTWQTGTVQLDFFMPKQFKMTYINSKGKKKQPVIIHRCLMGSLERFIGILLEHYGGALPLWLAPEQVWVVPVSQDQIKYAQGIACQLKKQNIRAIVNSEDQTLGKKIRQSEIQKIPYILIIGHKEVKNKNISVRSRGKGDLGTMTLEEFLEKLQ